VAQRPDIVRYPRHEVLVSPGVARGPGLSDRGRQPDALGLTYPTPTGVTYGDENRLRNRFTSIAGHVLRIRTDKSLTTPAGSFEITTTFERFDDVQRSSLHQLLVPGNQVTILLDAGTGRGLETVMTGPIISVGQRSTVNARGKPERFVTIAGADAGYWLLQHELPLHLLSAAAMGEPEITQRLAQGLIFRGSVGQVCRFLFRKLFLELVPVPQGGQQGIQLLTDPALEPEHIHFPEDALPSNIITDSVWGVYGKFWTLFRSYIDAPWNEAWGDYFEKPATENSPIGDFKEEPPIAPPANIGTPGYKLIVRPQPFSEHRWKALPVHVVRDSELILEDVRLSEDELVNLVMIKPAGHMPIASDRNVAAVFLRTTLFDRRSAARYGTRIFNGGPVPTRYSDVGAGHADSANQKQAEKGDGPIFDALQKRARRLWDYYSVNHILWKGTWILAGNPVIRIGQRVANQPEPSSFFDPNEYARRVFYVERVIQDYADGSHYRTHLALTRGGPLETEGFVRAREPDPFGQSVKDLSSDGSA